MQNNKILNKCANNISPLSYGGCKSTHLVMDELIKAGLVVVRIGKHFTTKRVLHSRA